MCSLQCPQILCHGLLPKESRIIALELRPRPRRDASRITESKKKKNQNKKSKHFYGPDFYLILKWTELVYITTGFIWVEPKTPQALSSKILCKFLTCLVCSVVKSECCVSSWETQHQGHSEKKAASRRKKKKASCERKHLQDSRPDKFSKPNHLHFSFRAGNTYVLMQGSGLIPSTIKKN